MLNQLKLYNQASNIKDHFYNEFETKVRWRKVYM